MGAVKNALPVGMCFADLKSSSRRKRLFRRVLTQSFSHFFLELQLGLLVETIN